MNSPIRFLLINPTADVWRVSTGAKPSPRTRIFRFSMLSSLYVAASLPPEVECRILDEDVEALDPDADVDIVGISFMTYNAPRAYAIANEFRRRGKTVFFGGYHPTLLPEEAVRHGDAVCIGEAEGCLPRMIADWRAGCLQKEYRNGLIDLRGLPIPKRALLRNGSYAPVVAVQATRGCPNRCSFCSITSFFGHRFRTRPADEVIAELKTLGSPLLFMDDNLTSSRDFALELFTKMIPLKKRWYSQCSVRIAYDEELLRAAAASGCRGLFIGFESLSEENLRSWKKSCSKARDYEWAIRKLHSYGIGVCAGVVFGYDWDTPRIFPEALQFLEDARVDALQATILTPFPGTELYGDFDRTGRITDRDWSHYDFGHVVFEPRGMSPGELLAGHGSVLERFYSSSAVARRVLRELRYLSPSTIATSSMPLNLSYQTRLRADGTIRG